MKTYSKIIALDFDGTLVTNEYPEIGEPIEKNIAKIKKEQSEGAKVILWTSRVGDYLKQAIEFCNSLEIRLDAVNENLPENIEIFRGDPRKIFASEYWDDRAVLMSEQDVCEPEEESETQSWAKQEIELACRRERADSKNRDEWCYGCACYESAFKAFKSLLGDRHSGYSIVMTRHILNRLIERKPLTPIEDTDDVWNHIVDVQKDHTCYQCKRMSSLFKNVYFDGRVTYRDIDLFRCVDINNQSAYASNLVQRLMDEMFPISMPYMPGKTINVCCEEFLTDKKNGDYDTQGILYAVKSDGERVEINRFFKEDCTGDWIEIDEAEYLERKAVKKK